MHTLTVQSDSFIFNESSELSVRYSQSTVILKWDKGMAYSNSGILLARCFKEHKNDSGL